jgi:hypothetical protein
MAYTGLALTARIPLCKPPRLPISAWTTNRFTMTGVIMRKIWLREGLSPPPKLGATTGRREKLTEHQKAEALQRLNSGESCRQIGKSFNVSHVTISRLQRAA